MLDFLLKWSRCLPPSPALGGVVIPRDKLPSNQFPHTYKLCSPFRFPPSTLSRPPTYPQALQSINLAQPNAEETLWQGCVFRRSPSCKGYQDCPAPHTPCNWPPIFNTTKLQSPRKWRDQMWTQQPLHPSTRTLKNGRPVFPWVLFHPANDFKKLKKSYLKCQ